MLAAMRPTTSTTRSASHAGSWYPQAGTPATTLTNSDGDPNMSHPPPPIHTLTRTLEDALDRQLSLFLTQAKASIHTSTLPSHSDHLPVVRNARILISPHAGFVYSGPSAACAYAAWDIANLSRVIVLGPSHHHPMQGCALSHCAFLDTPLGQLTCDATTTDHFAASGHFSWMSKSVDEAEHSLEMQFPFIVKVFKDANLRLPLITQVLVGHLTPDRERIYGDLVAHELMADPTCGLVVSSDFCHWGARFRFTHYTPVPTPVCACEHPRSYHLEYTHDSSDSPFGSNSSPDRNRWSLRKLVTLPKPHSPPVHLTVCASRSSKNHGPDGVPIHASIESLDRHGMHFIEQLDVPGWSNYLDSSRNTICGRNPISIALVALNLIFDYSLDRARDRIEPKSTLGPSLDAQDDLLDAGQYPVLRFVNYAQSSQCINVRDSSVSYAAAIATLPTGLADLYNEAFSSCI